MAARYLKGVPVRLRTILALAILPQLAFASCHFLLSRSAPSHALLVEILPVTYLAATYLQWLLFSAWIAWRYQYPVPAVMHLPHLLSFLPLLRHILLAAERKGIELSYLDLAWLHAVVTHSFSLPAAWLWQMRRSAFAIGQRFFPVAVYSLVALLLFVLYAGLDFGFARATYPFVLAILQFLLYLGTTLVLVLPRGHRAPLPLIAATAFALTNGVLLFDQVRSVIGVELSLSASSITQLFALYAFVLYSPTSAPRADRPTYKDHNPRRQRV